MTKTNFIINCLIKKDQNQWNQEFESRNTISLYVSSVNQSRFVSSKLLKTYFHISSKKILFWDLRLANITLPKRLSFT